jgi:hypothetical protein
MTTTTDSVNPGTDADGGKMPIMQQFWTTRFTAVHRRHRSDRLLHPVGRDGNRHHPDRQVVRTMQSPRENPP